MSVSVSRTSLLSRSAMALSRMWILLLCTAVLTSIGAPFNMAKDHGKAIEELKEQLKKLKDLPGLNEEEYLRYWKEAVKNDPKFARLHDLESLRHDQERVNMEQLVKDNPMIGERLAHNSEDVRSRLEEAKRANIERMRQLQRVQTMISDNGINLNNNDWAKRMEAFKDNLPPNFTKEDIVKRIHEQKEMLDKIDAERKAEFKRTEMQTEHRRKEMLKALDEKKRLEAEEEFRQRREKLRSHEKIHHPASEQQLEDVWEKEDGLERDQFDPRTFFHLHDTNSDKHLDAMEWETLFYKEIGKVYGDKMSDMEAREDLARMREHVINEMDKNNDGLVSLEEFLKYTKSSEFTDDEPWQSVVEEDNFKQDEFDKYEEDYDEYYDYEYDEHGNLVGYKTKPKGGIHEEEPADRMPSRVNEQGTPSDNPGNKPPQPGHEEGNPPANVNDQGQPPRSHGDDQGLPPRNHGDEQGHPPRQNQGIPGIDTPQIDDPQAVHFNPVSDGNNAVPAENQRV